MENAKGKFEAMVRMLREHDELSIQTIEDLLFEINREEGTTLVLVTHDLELANKTNQVIKLRGGKVEQQALAGV